MMPGTEAPSSAGATVPDGSVPHAPHLADGVLVVRVGEGEFGLPVPVVREVIRTPALSRVPFPPPDVVGLIGLRGVVIPVLDLSLRLTGRPVRPPGTVVIAEEPETREPIGLLVDRVLALLEPGEGERREPPPEAEASLPAGSVAYVQVPAPGRAVTVLDPRAILPNPQRHGDHEPVPHSPSDNEP